MNLRTPTASRGTQLEGKRDVARIIANGCVITSWSRGVFFYELLSQSRHTHLLRDLDDVSRFSLSRMWGHLKTKL